MVKIQLAGIIKYVHESVVSAFRTLGWERVEDKPRGERPEAKPSVKDSGTITAKPVKRKTK